MAFWRELRRRAGFGCYELENPVDLRSPRGLRRANSVRAPWHRNGAECGEKSYRSGGCVYSCVLVLLCGASRSRSPWDYRSVLRARTHVSACNFFLFDHRCIGGRKSRMSSNSPSKGPSGGRGARFSGAMDPAAAALNASIDFDRRLLMDDVRGSQAHARMLASVGLVSAADADAIARGLEQVAGEFERGERQLDAALEDVHMNVESRLIELVG